MPTPAEAYSRLASSLGPEAASAVLGRLVHVPGGLNRLTEGPALLALHRSEAARTSPAATALLAATGYAGFGELPETWPAPVAARRAELLRDESAESVGSPTPDDTLILVGEILEAQQQAGARGVADLVQRHALDWRGPLACVWSAIDDRADLAQALVATPALPALAAALRANHDASEAAQVLAASAGARLPAILARLLPDGAVAFP